MIIFALVCNTILGLARKPVNFLLEYVTFMIKLAFSLNSLSATTAEGDTSYGATEDYILRQLPTSLVDSMHQMNLEGKTVLYAVCPSCHHLHAPTVSTTKVSTWASQCENEVVGGEGRSPCSTSLLDRGRPLKPFLSPCFLDYLARLLSNPLIEQLAEDAARDAIQWKPNPPPNDFVENALQAQFMQTFNAPGKRQLFLNQNRILPLAFSIGMDFYPPRGSGIHSLSVSVGVLKLSCVNLPIDERNAAENVYVSVLPGPRLPRARI
jgi:hypothetical protein